MTDEQKRQWEQIADETHVLVCGDLPHYPFERQLGPPRCELLANHFITHYQPLTRNGSKTPLLLPKRPRIAQKREGDNRI